MKLSKSQHMAIFLIPLMVFAVWIGSLEWGRIHAQRLEVPIRGADPRDLLSGHYALYQLELGEKNPCMSRSLPGAKAPPPAAREQAQCLCWSQTSDLSTLDWAGACEDKPATCSVLMRGQCHFDRFEAGIERTYIPEADAPLLRQLPEGSRVELRVTKDGRSFVEQLKPAGVPYKDWIARSRGPN